MSLENSIESLAKALQAHAGAIEKLAAALAVRGAANAERFAPAARGDWEAGGCEAVEKGIPVKPGEDPNDLPFEAPVEKPKAFSLEDARGKATSVLKSKGADTLRALLAEVGVKKLSALSAEQIQTFCANADKALLEA